MNYINEFLNLKCSGDVLNVVSPLGPKANKEITESMGIIKHIRSLTLKHPMGFTLYDFCAGNALTSVLSSYLLPIKNSIAIDIKVRKRNWKHAKRFEYQFQDIHNFNTNNIEENSIIISVHPCTQLAYDVINLFKKSKASYLFLMPCCSGRLDGRNTLITNKLGKYFGWCTQLSNTCDGKMYEDVHILSPKNIIIKAKKEGE